VNSVDQASPPATSFQVVDEPVDLLVRHGPVELAVLVLDIAVE
jgi:hypothetical protein